MGWNKIGYAMAKIESGRVCKKAKGNKVQMQHHAFTMEKKASKKSPCRRKKGGRKSSKPREGEERPPYDGLVTLKSLNRLAAYAALENP